MTTQETCPHCGHVSKATPAQPSNIIDFRSGKSASIAALKSDEVAPDVVLSALLGRLQSVVVAGLDSAGDEVFASSSPRAAEVLWVLARVQQVVVNGSPVLQVED